MHAKGKVCIAIPPPVPPSPYPPLVQETTQRETTEQTCLPIISQLIEHTCTIMTRNTVLWTLDGRHILSRCPPCSIIRRIRMRSRTVGVAAFYSVVPCEGITTIPETEAKGNCSCSAGVFTERNATCGAKCNSADKTPRTTGCTRSTRRQPHYTHGPGCLG